MSRIGLLEQLYLQTLSKDPSEFMYDSLVAPPMMSLLTPQDLQSLENIATSLRYNANTEKKYKAINEIMNRRGFRKQNGGTNRITYTFLEDPTFICKVAFDRVGMKDNPAEFKNQQYLKPFCTRIFEVCPSGVANIAERVNPISSLDEFSYNLKSIVELLYATVYRKLIMADIGVTKYMNFGIRAGFGPVFLDFPYVYEMDQRKLICRKPIMTARGLQPCGGEIDYDAGFDNIVCTKCGRRYEAKDIATNKDIIIMETGGRSMCKVRIINRKTKEVIMDDTTSSNTHITKSEYEQYVTNVEEREDGEKVPAKRIRDKKKPTKTASSMFSDLALHYYDKDNKSGRLTSKPFNEKFNVIKVKNVKEEPVAEITDPDEAIDAIMSKYIIKKDDELEIPTKVQMGGEVKIVVPEKEEEEEEQQKEPVVIQAATVYHPEHGVTTEDPVEVEEEKPIEEYYDEDPLEEDDTEEEEERTEEEDEEVIIHPDPELEDVANHIVDILFKDPEDQLSDDINLELGKVIDKESGDEFLLDGAACTNYIDMKKHNKVISLKCTGNFSLVAFHYDNKDEDSVWVNMYEVIDINADKILSTSDMIRLSISNILEDSTITIDGITFDLPKHEEPKEEVNLDGFFIGSNVDEEQEPDYSDYEPAEEEETQEEEQEEERVSFSEFKERRHKKHKDMKFKDNNEDMDEY